MLHQMRISMFAIFMCSVVLCVKVFGQSTLVADSSQVTNMEDDINNYIHKVTAATFEQFVSDKNVRILYFFKKNMPRMKKFKNEFEKSASYLINYEVAFGWIDCTTENIMGYCDKKGVETEIYAFKNGEMLLDLTLETMFDVNSMVSNVLQIVLLREVPILQSQAERKEFEMKNEDQKHIFFAYFPAIGTQEHRIFMEVAYMYRNKHLFSLTTEKEAVADLGYSKKASIWCIQAKNIKSENLNNYKIHRYQGKFNLISFKNFVSTMSSPKYYELNKIEDLEINPFEDAQMHLGIIFYDSNSESKARRTIESLSAGFVGVIGFFLCNTEKVDTSAFGLLENTGPLPLLAVLFHDEEEPVFIDQHDIEKHGVSLVTQELSKRVGINPTIVGDSTIGESEISDINNDPSEIEKQDDQVALGAYSLRKDEVKEAFTVLTDKSFTKETENKKLKIVLFYLPFDIQSQAFIRVYSKAATTLKQDGINVLAAINCFDWTDVCTKNNITSYPLMIIYRMGKTPKHYKGLLDYSDVISTVKMFLFKTPVILHKEEDVKKFSEGQIPENIGFFTNTSVVAMATANKDIMFFKELADILHGSVICGLVTGTALSNQIARKFNCQPPCVVIHKKDDVYQPYHVLKQEASASKMAQSLIDAKIPKLSQISVQSFPVLYARRQPMVILFDKNLKPKAGLHGIMGNVASSGKFPSVTFTFIDIEEQRNLGGNLLSHYQLGTKIPSIFIVNTNKHTIHKYQEESITENGVSIWLQKVLEGSIEPDRLMEKKRWAPRHKGYDYLLMLDEDQKQFEEEDIGRNSFEEDNLGFDENGEEVGHEYEGGSGKVKDVGSEVEDDIEQDLHDLKKSRLFHTRDTSSTEHNRIHSNMPPNTGSANENGHRHSEL